MALEFKRGIGIGRTDVYEDGKEIGYISQSEGMSGRLHRDEGCSVHAWKHATTWGPTEDFPGDKAPKHWEEMHGES